MTCDSCDSTKRGVCVCVWWDLRAGVGVSLSDCLHLWSNYSMRTPVSLGSPAAATEWPLLISRQEEQLSPGPPLALLPCALPLLTHCPCPHTPMPLALFTGLPKRCSNRVPTFRYDWAFPFNPSVFWAFFINSIRILEIQYRFFPKYIF